MLVAPGWRSTGLEFDDEEWFAAIRLLGEYAALYPAGCAEVQAGAGHFPWLDDPRVFVATVTAFMT